MDFFFLASLRKFREVERFVRRYIVVRVKLCILGRIELGLVICSGLFSFYKIFVR